MQHRFFTKTKYEFQIYTNEKLQFFYDHNFYGVGIYTHALGLGIITICWGL